MKNSKRKTEKSSNLLIWHAQSQKLNLTSDPSRWAELSRWPIGSALIKLLIFLAFWNWKGFIKDRKCVLLHKFFIHNKPTWADKHELGWADLSWADANRLISLNLTYHYAIQLQWIRCSLESSQFKCSQVLTFSSQQKRF